MSDAPSPDPAEAVNDPELPAPLPGGGSGPESAPGLEPPIRRRLSGRRITLCVSGSIAAYKSAVLLRLLRKEAAEVEVVLSRSAEKFIGRATFAGLNQKPPLSDMFAPEQGGELHVDLAARSDLVL